MRSKWVLRGLWHAFRLKLTRQKKELMARILIFASDVLLIELVRTTLAGLQAEIRTATSWADFDRLTARMVFEVVLVLEVAPLWCGRAFFRRLRPRSLRRPEIFVIAWHQSDETVLSLLECGVDQYLTFPLNPARLRSKVIRSLG